MENGRLDKRKNERKIRRKMEDLIKLTQLKFVTVPESLEKIIKQC